MPTSVVMLMMMSSENKTPCQSLALTGCGGDHLINPLRERVFRRASRSDELFELRHDLEQIAYQAVVGHLEDRRFLDRKSTRLNSSHVKISYAVFCLKKKKENKT